MSDRQMSVFKNGKFYHYEFILDGRRRRGSTGTANKQQAIAEERRQRERLEKKLQPSPRRGSTRTAAENDPGSRR